MASNAQYDDRGGSAILGRHFQQAHLQFAVEFLLITFGGLCLFFSARRHIDREQTSSQKSREGDKGSGTGSNENEKEPEPTNGSIHPPPKTQEVVDTIRRRDDAGDDGRRRKKHLAIRSPPSFPWEQDIIRKKGHSPPSATPRTVSKSSLSPKPNLEELMATMTFANNTGLRTPSCPCCQ